MSELFRSQGRFFVQEDLDTLHYLLTCTGTGDVDMPAGDETPVYCPSRSEVGKFIITGAVEGEVGFTTYSLVRPLQTVVNYLLTELTDCRFHGRVNWSLKGSTPDVMFDYVIALHLHNSRVNSRGVGQPTVMQPGDNERIETNADINAYDWRVIYPVTSSRITLTEPSGLNGIHFDRSSVCYSEEIGGEAIGKDGYFTSDTPAGSAALTGEVYYTEDYGDTWTGCAADPFAAAESPGPVQTRGGRVIVGRITGDAGNPAEIAYSDDFGDTWTNVDLGATDDQTIDALWWLDWTHCWAAASGGYVYFSDDGGVTWTAQTSGGVTGQNLRDICAYDENNVWASGATGALIRTTNGEAWVAVTGPAGVADQFNTVFMENSTRVFIGSNAGNMYRTADGGVTWTGAFGTPQWASGEVMKIRGELDLRYFIYVIGDDSGSEGEVYRSEDGGVSFQAVTIATNAGLRDIDVIDPNTAFTGGEPQGGTAFLAKIEAVS